MTLVAREHATAGLHLPGRWTHRMRPPAHRASALTSTAAVAVGAVVGVVLGIAICAGLLAAYLAV